MKRLLVLGALGLVGRAVVEHFAALPGVQVLGLARRAADFAPGATWLRADLQDAAATAAALAPHRSGITHVVYAALNEQPGLVAGWRSAENMALNTRMLAHALAALQGAPLQHITLLQGTKAYGLHTGRAMPVPAREHEAQRDHSNFYFDQQDMVADLAARAGFGWTAFRPQIVLGVALGSAMNPVAAIGVHAALCQARGLPLCFPGHPHLLTECTDARLIAQAVHWAWQAPQAHGEVFNITNGDVVVWQSVYRAVAAHLGLALGDPAALRMAEAMPAQAGLWRQLALQHGLREPDLQALVGLSWQYADATFASQRPFALPPLVSTIKLREAGFGACIDTERCVLEHLDAMRAQRYLP